MWKVLGSRGKGEWIGVVLIERKRDQKKKMDEREQLNNTIGRKSQAIEEISRARKKEEKQQAKIKKKTYLTSREIQKYSKIEKNYSGQEKKNLSRDGRHF